MLIEKSKKQTKIFMNDKMRALLSMMFIFGLLLSFTWRQSNTAKVSAQSSENEIVSSPDSSTITNSNPAPITINDNTTASLYPSPITISGVNPATVTKVTARLNGFSHTYPDDVDIILVGPQGQRSILMSDAGISAPTTNINLTFDQTAASAIPDKTLLTTGTYRPANYEPLNIDNFPTPGPGALTNATADLNVFNLTNPNGVWNLYVVDDAGGDTGSISGGWSLTLTVPIIFTVNSTADTTDGSCTAANCTLREAITAASNGDLINFSSLFNTSQTINLLTALPNIATSVTIQGPNTNLLNVRRDYAAPDFRIFNILSGISNVAISGMTISNGRLTGAGGGIFSQSNLTLTNVHVTGNQAQNGGGVYLTNGDGFFVGCTFSNNSVTTNGGGVLFQGGARTLRVTNSTLSGNSAGANGGGIFNLGDGGNAPSRIELTSSTITDNRVVANGGGVFTFTQNGVGNTATTTLRNTIIANNTTNNLVTSTSGGGAATYQTLGFNLSDNFNGVFTPAANDILTVTPRLAPLSLSGLFAPTHTLLGGSPALDAGDRSGLSFDQRGAGRVFDTQGVPNVSDGADIGAVEMQSIIVTNANDFGAGSLRQAITDANVTPQLNDIIFSNTVFNTGTISLVTALPDITGSITLNGPGANLLTVRRNDGAPDFRILRVAFGVGSVGISGMTISNGRTPDFGGGISSDSPLFMTAVHVSGNHAEEGGGVALFFADGIFNGCTFSGNTSTFQAGGIRYNGQGGAGHTLRIINSTVSGNIAGTTIGGIFNLSTGGNSQLEVTNSTIVNNSATASGGIRTFTQGGTGNTATTTLRNIIIANNTPTNLEVGTFGGGPTTVTTNGFNLSNNFNGVFTPLSTDIAA